MDENTCSDGEFWAEAAQRRGTKVVGVRTWGGAPRPLFVESLGAEVTATGAADLELPAGHLTLPPCGISGEGDAF